MISFENDYNKGAHPTVLAALAATNEQPCSGYGHDPFCESAAEKIRAACECPQAQVAFLAGGTQSNAAVIRSLLKEYEGVIAAETGHVNVHEAGAIEATGHKVLTLPSRDGKVAADDLAAYLRTFYADESHEHMVFPGMVYISFPTEIGTLYSKAELTALSAVCREYHIPLYLDGARLGYGLASPACDVTLPELAALTDVLYIGGTKVGTLLGEAIVFTKHNMPDHFETIIKRHSALLAKGRVLGVQFDALFTDGLYFEIGRHAMKQAARLCEILRAAGCRFYIDSPTNQQFVILENRQVEALAQRIKFSFWEHYDETHTVIRLVTSWGTTDAELDALAQALTEI